MYAYVCIMYVYTERERIIMNPQSGPKFMAVLQQTDRSWTHSMKLGYPHIFLNCFSYLQKFLKCVILKLKN